MKIKDIKNGMVIKSNFRNELHKVEKTDDIITIKNISLTGGDYTFNLKEVYEVKALELLIKHYHKTK